MKDQHTFKVGEKSYILQEPMTTACATMLIRLKDIVLPSLGGAEEGFQKVAEVFSAKLTPAEFLEISKELVSWCKSEKGIELDYDTEFRGGPGIKNLYLFLKQVLILVYADFFDELKTEFQTAFKKFQAAKKKIQAVK